MALQFFSSQITSQPVSISSLSKVYKYNNSANYACKTVKCTMEEKQKREGNKKTIWVWTNNQNVMSASVERGWSTFLFKSEPEFKQLANHWSSMAMINPLFLEGFDIRDGDNKKVGNFYEISSPEDLEALNPDEMEVNNTVINFNSDWKVIPAENLVAKFQDFKGSVLAVSQNSTDSQVFLEALEQGLDGVVLKVENPEDIIKLKEYMEMRKGQNSKLELTKAKISKIKTVGMGDRVCVDLCSIMTPGEGLLVSSFARGLFLVHSECLETNYISSRPFRVNAGPVHAYVAVPGEKTSYLSELNAGKEVIIVDRLGSWRTAIVGRVKIESRPLILVEAKEGDETYSIFLQNAETVGLVCPDGDKTERRVIPITSLKVGDEVLIRKQGGARHTGIEIKEFILEK